MKTFKSKKRAKLPKSAIDEADDKPAARGIWITMFIVICILGIVYFFFFKDYIHSLFFAD